MSLELGYRFRASLQPATGLGLTPIEAEGVFLGAEDTFVCALVPASLASALNVAKTEVPLTGSAAKAHALFVRIPISAVTSRPDVWSRGAHVFPEDFRPDCVAFVQSSGLGAQLSSASDAGGEAADSGDHVLGVNTAAAGPARVEGAAAPSMAASSSGLQAAAGAEAVAMAAGPVAKQALVAAAQPGTATPLQPHQLQLAQGQLAQAGLQALGAVAPSWWAGPAAPAAAAAVSAPLAAVASPLRADLTHIGSEDGTDTDSSEEERRHRRRQRRRRRKEEAAAGKQPDAALAELWSPDRARRERRAPGALFPAGAAGPMPPMPDVAPTRPIGAAPVYPAPGHPAPQPAAQPVQPGPPGAWAPPWAPGLGPSGPPGPECASIPRVPMAAVAPCPATVAGPQAAAAFGMPIDPMTAQFSQWMAAQMAAQQGHIEGMQRMINKLLKEKGKRRDGSSSSENGGSEEDRGTDCECRKVKKCGFTQLRRRRRKFHRRPETFYKRYKTRIMQKLNVVNAQQYWSWTDNSRRLKGRFGKYMTMCRIHFALSHALDFGERQEYQKIVPFLGLIQQALVTAAADFGSWENASLIIPTEDPLDQDPFGGDYNDLEAVFSYRKALRELQTKLTNVDKADADHE